MLGVDVSRAWLRCCKLDVWLNLLLEDQASIQIRGLYEFRKIRSPMEVVHGKQSIVAHAHEFVNVARPLHSRFSVEEVPLQQQSVCLFCAIRTNCTSGYTESIMPGPTYPRRRS